MDTLPTEILDLIMNNLDNRSKKQVRLVCHRLKKAVDLHLEFTVKLCDDTLDTFKKFHASSLIQTLVVEQFSMKMPSTSSSRSLLSGRKFKELVILGRSGFRQQRNCTASISLYPYIEGEPYTIREVIHWPSRENYLPPLLESNLKMLLGSMSIVTTLCFSTDAFISISKPTLLLNFQCPKLKTLEVTVCHHASPRAKLQVQKCLVSLFKNKFDLLDNVTLICGCDCSCKSAPQAIWLEFMNFLCIHASTLEELKLQHFHTFNYDESGLPATRVQKIASDVKNIQLKRLSLVVRGYALRHDNLILENSFEMQLLKHQRALEVLKLDTVIHIPEIINHVLPHCPSLKACSIHLVTGPNSEETIKLHFLEHARNLKMLQILIDEDRASQSLWRIEGVEKISTSIQYLSLSSKLTMEQAGWIQRNLVNLVKLNYVQGVRLGTGGAIPTQLIDRTNCQHYRVCCQRMNNLTEFTLAWYNTMISRFNCLHPSNVRFYPKGIFPVIHVHGFLQH